jgi:Lar family restriction alleviation protein
MSIDADKLMPCPFCGGEAKLHTYRTSEDSEGAHVECASCGARTEATDDAYGDAATARMIWNTRAARTEPAGAVEAAAAAMERHMFAPHELPLSAELHAKYLDNARGVIAAISALSATPVPEGWRTIADEIAAERKRQIEQEGWTAEHDDEHVRGEMALAAACYAAGTAVDQAERAVMDTFGDSGTPFRIKKMWPWSPEWWKPKNRRRDLVRAGALIVAEIERLDRAMLDAAPAETGGR